ncbi:unnamed protein product [Acanthosepion pharaonis]|uniref:Uncharacterized protein n=1 Tax=Acanthosepion pharaonis TaxID=158019 RepID=A0A812AN31_ACAPH|nr:unnamed protein product [Sepia pharaonis]
MRSTLFLFLFYSLFLTFSFLCLSPTSFFPYFLNLSLNAIHSFSLSLLLSFSHFLIPLSLTHIFLSLFPPSFSKCDLFSFFYSLFSFHSSVSFLSLFFSFLSVSFLFPFTLFSPFSFLCLSPIFLFPISSICDPSFSLSLLLSFSHFLIPLSLPSFFPYFLFFL